MSSKVYYSNKEDQYGQIIGSYNPYMRRRYNLYYEQPMKPLTIKDVIFNDPATIVFWSDDTKTVVKASKEDTYDPEKGLAMAISEKVLGSYSQFKKWLPKEEGLTLHVDGAVLSKALHDLTEAIFND